MLAGVLCSSIGTWVQRIGQDWLIFDLTESPTSIGITSACQFAPTVALGWVGGAVADRYPKRVILMFTQLAMGCLSSALAMICLTGQVAPWHVYAGSLCLGLVTAIDNPTRQAFLSELVPRTELRNALGLTAAVFQLGAISGPVLGGVVMGRAGAEWCFAFNAVMYVGPMVALTLMRSGDLLRPAGGPVEVVTTPDSMRLVLGRPAVLCPILLVGVFGAFSLNMPVVLASLARSEHGADASVYGLLSSLVAAGSLTGALASAASTRSSRLRVLLAAALALSASYCLMAVAPNGRTLAVALFAFGVANLALLTLAQAMIQLGAPPALRGRIIGLYLLVFIGSGALGGPLVGLITERAGPRELLLIAGPIGALSALAVAIWLAHVSLSSCGSTWTRCRTG